MTRRVRLTILLSLLAVVALRAGQNPQTPANQTPTFRSGVEYVEVDAIVTDAKGEFVRDLKREDFQVLEDGSRQTISDFTLIDIPVERYDKPLYSPTPIEPDTRANEQPFDGRVYVMVIDDRHTDFSRTPRTKAAARLFIQQRLGANDIMAVVHTAGAEEASQEFTNNKRLLLAAVEKTVGRALPSSTFNRINQARSSFNTFVDDPQDLERAMNAESSLRLLKEIADWFQTVRGRRKAILFISEGIDYDITQVVAGYDNNSPSQPVRFGEPSSTTRAKPSTRRCDRTSASSASTRAGSSFPTSTPRSRAFPTIRRWRSAANLRNELRLSQDSLRALSDETGGFAVTAQNNFVGAFDRIVSDNSSYYVLAYYPPSDKRDGKFHKIEVRVNRPGLTVRARRGYLAPRGRPPAQPAPNEKGPSLALGTR